MPRPRRISGRILQKILFTSFSSSKLGFSESHTQGFLPPTFTDACITLIAKKGKDLTECASYRPTSLLNTYAKILAKVRANKLENVLPRIISKDQTGFAKGRQSYFNIRRLLNIIYTAPEDTSECVLSLDAEKAFDRVEWVYLFSVLKKSGFGPNFVSWIKLLYLNPKASIRTNSQRSISFSRNLSPATHGAKMTT